MWPDKHWVAKFLIFHGLRNFACGSRSLSSRSTSNNVLFLCKLKNFSGYVKVCVAWLVELTCASLCAVKS